MKKINYVLIMLLAFLMVGVVKAQNIELNQIIEKFQAKSGYTVTASVDGSSFTVNNGTSPIEYTYSGTDNILSYNVGTDKTVDEVVDKDDVLGFIVELSENSEAFATARVNYKAENPNGSASYGSGCDLTNMGFCYNPSSGSMQVAMSNQFTTYLYNFYSGNNGGNEVPEETSKNSVAPEVVNDDTTTGDSKNPDTGTFTEVGIIVALFALLLVVVNLKKRNETEFKI